VLKACLKVLQWIGRIEELGMINLLIDRRTDS